MDRSGGLSGGPSGPLARDIVTATERNGLRAIGHRLRGEGQLADRQAGRLFSLRGQWGRCLGEECGSGGVQTRTVWCVHSEGWTTHHFNCRHAQKPESQRRCFKVCEWHQDLFEWEVSEWGPCVLVPLLSNELRLRTASCVTAQHGIQRRHVQCVRTSNRTAVTERICEFFSHRPALEQACLIPCPHDCVVSDFSAWSGCSKTCGVGLQHRTRVVLATPMYGGANCPNLTQTRSCSNAALCLTGENEYEYSLKVGPWSECRLPQHKGLWLSGRTLLDFSVPAGSDKEKEKEKEKETNTVKRHIQTTLHHHHSHHHQQHHLHHHNPKAWDLEIGYQTRQVRCIRSDGRNAMLSIQYKVSAETCLTAPSAGHLLHEPGASTPRSFQPGARFSGFYPPPELSPDTPPPGFSTPRAFSPGTPLSNFSSPPVSSPGSGTSSFPTPSRTADPPTPRRSGRSSGATPAQAPAHRCLSQVSVPPPFSSHGRPSVVSRTAERPYRSRRASSPAPSRGSEGSSASQRNSPGQRNIPRTMAQIRSELSRRGIRFSRSARKDILLRLLRLSDSRLPHSPPTPNQQQQASSLSPELLRSPGGIDQPDPPLPGFRSPSPAQLSPGLPSSSSAARRPICQASEYSQVAPAVPPPPNPVLASFDAFPPPSAEAPAISPGFPLQPAVASAFRLPAYTLASATPLPPPPHTPVHEPPPVSPSLRQQILSAKCAARVSLWNQCPYWGALDLELHNRVFLGCRPVVCAICCCPDHSSSHCPFVEGNSSNHKTAAAKSLSSVPRLPHSAGSVDQSESPDRILVPSINSLVPFEDYSMCYQTVDDAVRLIKLAGPNCWLFKADITAAFKVMPIHPDFWHLFGVQWEGQFYFAVRLTFGCRSSPKIFNTLSEALCWILQNNYDIKLLVHLLDDFLAVTPPSAPPTTGRQTILKVFSNLGVPISEEKTDSPAHSLEFLGITKMDSGYTRAPRRSVPQGLGVMASVPESMERPVHVLRRPCSFSRRPAIIHRRWSLRGIRRLFRWSMVR
ncbi:hypothetical protein ACEWY4_023348 [Coilia grayii]|uniref:ribonuclease H n=1 Tax=Coilia grayii TaxID=363190 RepID=A0ABD1J5A7_9TELE